MSDQELAEAQLAALREQGAPSVPGPLKSKAEFSHEALVSLIIANPTWTHKQYAEHFGRPASWFAAILATDAFQAALDPRRGEVSDPSITATLEERFRALTLRSITVLQQKLENAAVKDETVTKTLELGIKALAIGNGNDDSPKGAGSLEALADRLTGMLAVKKLQQNPSQPEVATASNGVIDVAMTEVKTNGN